jgi:inactivated superfamily I helicase
MSTKTHIVTAGYDIHTTWAARRQHHQAGTIVVHVAGEGSRDQGRACEPIDRPSAAEAWLPVELTAADMSTRRAGDRRDQP